MAAQSVLLYQRLTKIIAKLTDGVEAELQKRMDDIDNRAKQAAERIEQLNPHIDHLRDGLDKVKKHLTSDMEQAIMKSEARMKGGLEHAASLEQMLAVLLKTVMDSNSHIVAAQGESVELATRKANDELSSFVTVIASAAASSMALQNQIVSPAQPLSTNRS
jgi:chromosome segregation ATPase